MSSEPKDCSLGPIPGLSFHHVSRECMSVSTSKEWYKSVLGFKEIVRPPFETEGAWMAGPSVFLHLFATKSPDRCKLVAARREHFDTFAPEVDHFAFLTSASFDEVEALLQRHKARYHRVDVELTGATQLFVFDPDNNLIEVSNCAPPPDGVACERKTTAASADAKP